MASKYYVVWQGRKPGIYDNWNEAKQQVDKFAGAKYKSFTTLAQAKSAFANAPAASMAKSNKSQGKTVKKTEFTAPSADVVIYTDGGCEPNPGKAGSGVAVYQQGQLASLWYGLYNPNGTNNTAELNALYQAILMAKTALAKGKTVHILSDSQYSINCITNWAYGWKAKGWVKKSGDIANLDIIKQAHELFDQLKDQLIIEHVAAHVGIEGNELADRMSIYAVDQQQQDFCQYPAPFNVQDIMSLRAG